MRVQCLSCVKLDERVKHEEKCSAGIWSALEDGSVLSDHAYAVMVAEPRICSEYVRAWEE